VSRRTLRIVRALGFRYDYTRDSYVLPLIGGRVGPVFRDEARRRTD
jgi:hypothetical protein